MKTILKFIILVSVFVSFSFCKTQQKTTKSTTSKDSVQIATTKESEIKSSDISKHPTENIDQQLQGSTSGIKVKTTEADQKMDIQIRGIHSLNLSNDPLWVVDDIVYENIHSVNDLQMIVNIHDIESYQVLKDARSCAQYGSRGANGVIKIKTKSSK